MTSSAAAQSPRVIPLWAEGSKNNEASDGRRPMLEYYPAGDHASLKRGVPGGPGGPAVIVCPGGAYVNLAPHEGAPFAELFASHGMAAFVLTYRRKPDYFPAPYADAARAVRLVRSMAGELGIDPARVALMGFSAGGHLAATVATQPDLHHDPDDDLVGRFSARPDRVILGYPVMSFVSHPHLGSIKNLLGPDTLHTSPQARQMSNELHVTSKNPPAFIFHTFDDAGVPVQNAIMFARACADHGVNCELHIFEHGRHGVGLALDDPRLRVWGDLLIAWLKDWPG